MCTGLQRWIGVGIFLLVLVLPLFALLLPPTQPGITFWWDFAIGIGFCAVMLIGLMFLLTARFRLITRPFGIDLIYYFHRQLGMIILLLILAHPLILILTEPLLIEYLKPSAPWPMNAGTLAIIVLCILIVASLLHQYIPYESWRRGHALLAVSGMLLVLLHINGAGYYVAGWKQVMWLLLSGGWLLLLVLVRLVHPFRSSQRPWQLLKLEQERGNAVTITLGNNTNAPFQFQPGQFAWLSIRSSPFQMNEHPFSIASSACDPAQLQFTIKALGDCTAQIHTLALGETVYVDGPYGSFSCDRFADAKSLVFIAGGIGIVPMMSMLRTLHDRHDARELVLIYAYRDMASLTYYEELNHLSAELNLKITYVLYQPPDDWQGERGCITPAMLGKLLAGQSSSTHYFICGPAPMMRMVEQALHQQGIRFGQIHNEIFNLI